jgi:outer membrane protein assembly factor BamD (BamD/ComL family)
MVQLGLLYSNRGENDKAIVQYKKVIENYKSTPEARNAMTGLKNTYVEINDVESYFAYTKTLQGYGDVNLAEKDSLLYTSGENLYITGKYDKSTEAFKNYLNEFPNGSVQEMKMMLLNYTSYLRMHLLINLRNNRLLLQLQLIMAKKISKLLWNIMKSSKKLPEALKIKLLL